MSAPGDHSYCLQSSTEDESDLYILLCYRVQLINMFLILGKETSFDQLMIYH